MGSMMTMNSKTTVADVRAMLREDEYDPALAKAVRRAFKRGALVWTTERLPTTDESRIDARPVREE